MRSIKIVPLLFIFLNANESVLTSNNIIFSENSNTTCNIAFGKLLQEGLETHPSMNMSKDIIQGADEEVDSAFWEYFPTPSVDVSVADKNQLQTVVRLEQPIWTGGKLDASYAKAKAKRSEAEYSYDKYQYELIENYLNSLENYLLAKQTIEVLNDNKRQFDLLNEMLERMIQAGVSSESDKNLLKSRRAKIYSDLVVANAKLKVSKIQFEILSSRKIDCNIDFEFNELLGTNLYIEKLIEEMRNFHPALKEIDAQIKSAKSEIDMSKSKLWPTLSLRGEYRDGSLYTEIDEPYDKTLVYLALHASSGAGLSSLSNISAARINVSKVEYQKATQEKELIDELMGDYTSYISAKSNMEVISSNIVTLERIYESDKRLFLLQEKKWLDLVNSLSELNKHKIEHSQQSIKKIILEYKMFLKTGKIDLKTGDIVNDIQ